MVDIRPTLKKKDGLNVSLHKFQYIGIYINTATRLIRKLNSFNLLNSLKVYATPPWSVILLNRGLNAKLLLNREVHEARYRQNPLPQVLKTLG